MVTHCAYFGRGKGFCDDGIKAFQLKNMTRGNSGFTRLSFKFESGIPSMTSLLIHVVTSLLKYLPLGGKVDEVRKTFRPSAWSEVRRNSLAKFAAGKKNTSGSQSYQTFFLRKRRIFTFFADKLDHFSWMYIFPFLTNTQA